MSNTIVDLLNELRSQRAGHLRSKTLASSGEVAEAKVWAGYHEAVAEVRRVWGEPAFEGPGSRADLSPDGVRRVYGEPASEGPGWRAGYKGDCPSPDLYFWQLYCQALRIGWWKRDGFVNAVMVTGHDANTLQILQLAVAEAGEVGA